MSPEALEPGRTSGRAMPWPCRSRRVPRPRHEANPRETTETVTLEANPGVARLKARLEALARERAAGPEVAPGEPVRVAAGGHRPELVSRRPRRPYDRKNGRLTAARAAEARHPGLGIANGREPT